MKLDNYQASRERFTPCSIYQLSNPNTPNIIDKHEQLTPQYSYNDGVVFYTFKFDSTTAVEDVSTIIYGNTIVTADSYMVAIYTTEVQPLYIHDYYCFWFAINIFLSNRHRNRYRNNI